MKEIYSSYRNNVGGGSRCDRAFRYRRMKEIYTRYRNNVGGGYRCDGAFTLLYRVNGPLGTAA